MWMYLGSLLPTHIFHSNEFIHVFGSWKCVFFFVINACKYSLLENWYIQVVCCAWTLQRSSDCWENNQWNYHNTHESVRTWLFWPSSSDYSCQRDVKVPIFTHERWCYCGILKSRLITQINQTRRWDGRWQALMSVFPYFKPQKCLDMACFTYIAGAYQMGKPSCWWCSK